MASIAQQETALLTEHLQYTPLTLIDEIIDTINSLSSRAVDAAEKGLLAANPSDLGFVDAAKAENRSLEKDERGKYVVPEAEGEVRDGVHKLETLLQANIDINFDKFEIVALRSILHVPEELVPWIRLEHYNGIPQYAGTQELDDPDALIQLRQRYRETKKLQKALESTVKRNNAVLSAIRSLTSPAVEGQTMAGPFAFLSDSSAAENLGIGNVHPSETEAGPLETNVSFALSQLPALRELVAQLKPQLADLSSMTDQPIADGDIAKGRREYVETQSRIAVERQGLGVDNGALDSLGKAISAEELSALEAMAGELRN